MVRIPGVHRIFSTGLIFTARLFEQFDQSAQTILIHVPQLPAVHFLQRRIQGGKQCQGNWRNARSYDATVITIPASDDQLPFFQPVQQPRHIRVTRNHLLAYLATGQAVVTGRSKDSEDVELGGR